ncbi:beta-galactosidase trimerization domain-containing protein [Plantibacter flavus]
MIAPLLYLVSTETAENLTTFVERGGRLLASTFTDVVDETDSFRPGGYLRTLGDVFGISVEEYDALGRFVDGPIAGAPAFTANRFGDGVGYYLATIPDDDGMRSVIEWVADQAGVRAEIAGLPEFVEASRRGEHVLLINHGPEAVSLVIPPADGADTTAGVRLELGTQEWVWMHRP